MEQELDRNFERAAEAIREADSLIVAAGAGIGVDSGLPDFRGAEGFWRACFTHDCICASERLPTGDNARYTDRETIDHADIIHETRSSEFTVFSNDGSREEHRDVEAATKQGYHPGNANAQR
jgi:NAD-dependent SIR2 family protein deacetylase